MLIDRVIELHNPTIQIHGKETLDLKSFNHEIRMGLKYKIHCKEKTKDRTKLSIKKSTI